MSVKFSFDSKKLMKDLEKELKKSVESEVKNNPKKFLKGHEGKQYSGKCPKCGHNAVIINRGGNATCPNCGHTSKVELNVSWT